MDLPDFDAPATGLGMDKVIALTYSNFPLQFIIHNRDGFVLFP